MSDPARLVWHHRNPAEKEFSIAHVPWLRKSADAIEREIAKCDLLCRPCHIRVHHPER